MPADKSVARPKLFSKRTAYYICFRIANSVYFSILTTLLTIVALFGDDVRLVATRKPADSVFDAVTITCMVIFTLEIMVCIVGKPGYFPGFFFILDVVSTVTLVFDLTVVAEKLFGDRISDITMIDQSSSGSQTRTARAARISRVGAKAGRVVRLVRIVRLLKFVKFFNKSDQRKNMHPGDDWDNVADDDDEVHIGKESAVSKRLSEMTTQRVIGLVLSIMLVLPVFTPEFHIDGATSFKYGVNYVQTSLINGIDEYKPLASAANLTAYISSVSRRMYEQDFLMYLYYHNWHITEAVESASETAPFTSKMAWFGSLSKSAYTPIFLMGLRPEQELNSTWDESWSGSTWVRKNGDLPSPVRKLLERPTMFDESVLCVDNVYRGVSLIDPDAINDGNEIECPEQLRYQERSVVFSEYSMGDDDPLIIFVYDMRRYVGLDSVLNIAQTVFICILLCVGAMSFSNLANKLVLTPIERMMAKLDRIRQNPLEAMTMGDEEHHKEQVLASRKFRTACGTNGTFKGFNPHELNSIRNRFKRMLTRILPAQKPKSQQRKPSAIAETMETVVLEKTIIKIGSLLALGFGEAGAGIIGQNMKGGDSAGMNGMIPGVKVDAIFGFCDVRNFTDATEVLQDQVMVFVNRIASVVHSCAHDFFGNPNKNVGDAFLLVWRLSGHNRRKQRRLADMSLISFIKIIAACSRSALLAEYRNHPKLVKRLPNYRVRIGFGLHSGWAIEGAIGSEFKIDASYLSPNVNMAARLEGATKQFGVLILISDSLVGCMSPQIAMECRLVDHLAMTAHEAPLKVYTIDLDDLALEVDRSTIPVPRAKTDKFKSRMEQMRLRNERWKDDCKLFEMFDTDEDILIMRRKFTTEFECRFNMAYLNYEAGEWAVAQIMLNQTRFLLATEDGPSSALLRYMKQHDFMAPSDWPGYRILSEPVGQARRVSTAIRGRR